MNGLSDAWVGQTVLFLRAGRTPRPQTLTSFAESVQGFSVQEEGPRAWRLIPIPPEL